MRRGTASLDQYPVLEDGARHKQLADVPLRLKTFLGGGYDGQYSSYNLTSKLYHARLDDDRCIQLEVWSPPAGTKPTFEEVRRQEYRPAKKGDQFGPAWSNHWFRVTLRVPEAWSSYERVQLEWDSSGEALVYSDEGEPLQGLSGDSVRFDRYEFIVPSDARARGTASYYIEMSCTGMIGQTHDVPDDERKYLLRMADLVVPNMDAWRLKWDFETLKETYEELPETTLGQKCLHAANAAMTAFKRGGQEDIRRARKELGKVLESSKGVGKVGRGKLWSLGHCHIDTANLWTYSVTQQKAARSWASQLDLMDRYPFYNFTVTQCQQIKWLEELYPSLFSRIQDRIQEGRFQVLGATWVEMDTNIPSGEALCRQFLYGQKYFESRFGRRSTVFALPDSFGFSAQLPQIARLCGAENFYTQKMSWSLINHFPHSTFNWAGLDGSQLLAHMSPTELYNASCKIDEIRMNITNHGNIDVSPDAIFLFGHGDGGGGPTAPMLERLDRVKVLNSRPDAGGLLPEIRLDASFEGFYEHVRRKTDNGAALPVWRGEMYLERHRACQTSQAQTKKANRELEFKLRKAELLSTLACISSSHVDYPKKSLDSIWERLLLNQFHDVLAGSAFGLVFDEVADINAKLYNELDDIIDNAEVILFGQSEGSQTAHQGVMAVNQAIGQPRREVVRVPSRFRQFEGTQLSGTDYYHAIFETVPRYGHISAIPAKVSLSNRQVAMRFSGDSITLTTDSVAITIANGRITSILDIQLEKELLPKGRTSGLYIVEDVPHDYDAWEIESYAFDEPEELYLTDVRITETGPLRTVLTAAVPISDDSAMSCRITLDSIPASTNDGARHLVRFDADVDWHERHRLLYFSLPVNIRADYATYDAQFGVVKRPTHRNTSWDAAKFEVCGHKFADLSEYGYGVALINDCKYGYGVEGNCMRLSLLRGPTEPDKECDMGRHEFSWAIYPHLGSYAQSDVSQVATAFNTPMKIRAATASQSMFAMPFSVENAPNVVLETVKMGEDDQASGVRTAVLRLYEQYGGHASARLCVNGLQVRKIDVVNIMEDHLENLKVTKQGTCQSVRLGFRAWEIKTVKVTL